MAMKSLDWISFVLVVVGAINWGLVGFFNWNLVEALLGAWPMVVKIIYCLVGLAGLYSIWHASKM